MSTIVVGIDGSDGSQRALRFALEEARLRQASLKLVAAWNIPTAVYAGPMVLPIAPDDFAKSAQVALEQAIESLGDKGGVAVESVVEQGQPADILVAAAGKDDLLVVGSRGLGGFSGLLLGSVSQQAAQHARCPVVIVPHEDRS